MKEWPLLSRLRRQRVSRDDVVWCYRAFLDRLPESEEVFRAHEGSRGLRELVNTFLSSEEFRDSMRTRISREDVSWCYRRFLGREPESAEALSEAMGGGIRDLVNGLLSSPEFREHERAAHIADGARQQLAATAPDGTAQQLPTPAPAPEPLASSAPQERDARTLPDRATATRLVASQPWHHDFEVIPGLRTGGTYDPRALWGELNLPGDMSGLSLADVGASSGFFSFEAYRRGARVEAFDIRHKDNSGFGLAQYINGMDGIGHHHVNVLSLEARIYGQFDIVLCLGLLYHTSDPYLALRRCAALARGRLLVESHCSDQMLPQDVVGDTVMKFWPDPAQAPARGLAQDRSNFWSPTSECLRRMVEDMGFAVERLTLNGDRVLVDATRQTEREATTRLGIAYGLMPAYARGADPDDPAAWKIF